jgi:hypothetical protein
MVPLAAAASGNAIGWCSSILLRPCTLHFPEFCGPDLHSIRRLQTIEVLIPELAELMRYLERACVFVHTVGMDELYQQVDELMQL